MHSGYSYRLAAKKFRSLALPLQLFSLFPFLHFYIYNSFLSEANIIKEFSRNSSWIYFEEKMMTWILSAFSLPQTVSSKSGKSVYPSGAKS